MATPDLSVFDRIKTKADFDREEEMFTLKRAAVQQAKAGNLPAALQIADRLTQLRASGDPNADQQIQDVMMAQKMLRVDPGVYMNDGVAGEIPNYGNVVGGIEGNKAYQKQENQNYSDRTWLPGTDAAREAAKQGQTGPVPLTPSQLEEERASGRGAGDAESEANKRQLKGAEMLRLTTKAEEYLPDATSGAMSNYLYKKPLQIFGVSTDQSKADRQLKIIGGALTSNVPRMEGPQGVLDVELYKQMAGDLGNENLPIEDRMAALKTIQELNAKYETQNNSNVGATQPPALDPRNIPMEAVRELRADPSGAAEFDEVFGEGAARMVLGGQ